MRTWAARATTAVVMAASGCGGSVGGSGESRADDVPADSVGVPGEDPSDSAEDAASGEDAASPVGDLPLVADTLIVGTDDVPSVAIDADPLDTWTEPEEVAEAPVVLPAGLVGKAVPAGTGLPSLAAVVDSKKTPVTAALFLGHWTVIWFYPQAGTFG